MKKMVSVLVLALTMAGVSYGNITNEVMTMYPQEMVQEWLDANANRPPSQISALLEDFKYKYLTYVENKEQGLATLAPYFGDADMESVLQNSLDACTTLSKLASMYSSIANADHTIGITAKGVMNYYNLTSDHADAFLQGELNLDELTVEQKTFLFETQDPSRESLPDKISDFNVVRLYWINQYAKQVRAELSDEQYLVNRFLYSRLPQIRYNLNHLSEFLNEIQKGVRTVMRQNGQSFVTVDGVNPVETAIQPIIDAVNAPMLQGLEEACLQQAGVTVTVDRSMQAELEQIRDDVWNGIVLPDQGKLNAIRFLLGTEGFNSFVEAYNGQ